MIQFHIFINFSRKIVPPVLGLALILTTSNLALANEQESSRLMFKAAKLSLEGENEKTLKILLEIARREPRNFYAHNNVEMVYVELKEYDKAYEAYEKSLALNPTFPMVLNNIGHLKMTLGHYEKAEASFKKALIYFKSFHLVSANLGDLYLRQKRYDEAMKHLK
ncbi:MAG: tetratricopeptide repeat protein [Nitrospinaceae bacterium]|jgi:tetratricopeptide (TPR) repeat protein|nr:tetratricopeptide repeat protein [Nitrospinaceae bacterium]